MPDKEHMKKVQKCPNYLVRIGEDGVESTRIPCVLPKGHVGDCSFRELKKVGKRT
jgi:hypothetical protein